MKRKCRYRKSPANVSYYKQFLNDTVVLMKEAERNYWLIECGKLAYMDDRSKWKAIDRLTNQQFANSVQPVRSQLQGHSVYLFHDDDIVAEMEKHDGTLKLVTKSATHNPFSNEIDSRNCS